MNLLQNNEIKWSPRQHAGTIWNVTQMIVKMLLHALMTQWFALNDAVFISNILTPPNSVSGSKNVFFIRSKTYPPISTHLNLFTYMPATTSTCTYRFSKMTNKNLQTTIGMLALRFPQLTTFDLELGLIHAHFPRIAQRDERTGDRQAGVAPLHRK